MKFNSFGEYIGAVLDNINDEYESTGLYGSLTQSEKDTIFNKLAEHFNSNDSASNAASDIVFYIRERKYFENP